MKKRIMIVDDEIDIAETARIRLEASGYEVSTTVGENSLEDIGNYKPDLILLDVMMPDLDGFAIIRELKRDPDLSKVPVIIFSGKPKDALIELFGPEGIAGYISKPYDPKDMMAQIKQVLGG